MTIADLQYFPPITFFSASFDETNVAFNEYDRYKKMGFGNRCLIAGANNLIGLSIPLEGGRRQKASLKEIRVSQTEAWQKRHWRSLHSAYNRSPFFEHYAAELEEMYRVKQVWLLDWNRSCLEWVKAKTGWPPEITFRPEPNTERSPQQKAAMSPGPSVRDWRNKILPENYLLFKAPVYRQVFEDTLGFQANLSVLDLLFNTGPEATAFLRQPTGQNEQTLYTR